MPSLFSALQAVLKRWFGAPSRQSMSADAPALEISANDLQNTSMQAEEYTQHHSQIVPYDENLLERSRTQWQFGDWESLAQLSRDTLQHHPDRAKLALLAVAGLLQQGENDTARQFIRLAQDWGCNKKLISQILVAGVHNSLGRAAAVGGQEQRAVGHFENAIVTGMPGGDVRLLAQARVGQQFSNLGIRTQVSGQIVAPDEQIIYPPHGITSYAQNFEDVMLWRALWNVEDGFYIDAGAWDPVVDSVSKAFYEQGWRGVHVEPLPEYADMIRDDRPDEKVYQVLLGAKPGEKTFYYIPETGLSTASWEFAERHRQVGWRIEERKYPVMTLAQLFADAGNRTVHWLKIDVEGMEDQVLAGWGLHPARPWIVLVEATEPNKTMPTWKEWQHHLEEREYKFVYFDGLNRFYVHQDHANLAGFMKAPPNVFDQFEKIRKTTG